MEAIEINKKRVEVGDAHGIFNLGSCYFEGLFGLPRNLAKALELWHQARELGYADAYYNIGIAYRNGDGVERDKKKAEHYYELAAMGGVPGARFNLGNAEGRAGNWKRAIKHWSIAAGGGYSDSVKSIQQLYTNGHVPKDDYAKALRAYQAYLSEIKSEQRDEAAAFNEVVFKYY